MQLLDVHDEFRADCDRVIRSRAFRSLVGKTQVVPLPRSDRLRTRMTHVLEVTSLARSMARALGLREALVEAIGLAHDLGHPAFGHVGERVLAHLSGNFHHASHGVRVVELLEPMSLAPEVRAGILLHSKGKGAILAPRSHAEIPYATREASVVRVADLIAYASHDLDDAASLGYVVESELPRVVTDFLARLGGAGSLPDRVVRAFRTDVLATTATSLNGAIGMSVEGEVALAALRTEMFERFYERKELLAYVPKIRDVLEVVYQRAVRGRTSREALDSVAAMTDRAAMASYESAMRTRARRARQTLPPGHRGPDVIVLHEKVG